MLPGSFFPEALEGRVPQLLVGRPAAILHLGDELGLRPDDAIAGEARQPIGECALLATERLQLLPQ
jgi:hypothetical protein